MVRGSKHSAWQHSFTTTLILFPFLNAKLINYIPSPVRNAAFILYKANIIRIVIRIPLEQHTDESSPSTWVCAVQSSLAAAGIAAPLPGRASCSEPQEPKKQTQQRFIIRDGVGKGMQNDSLLSLPCFLATEQQRKAASDRFRTNISAHNTVWCWNTLL